MTRFLAIVVLCASAFGQATYSGQNLDSGAAIFGWTLAGAPLTYSARTDNCVTGAESGCISGATTGGAGSVLSFLLGTTDPVPFADITSGNAGVNSISTDPDFGSYLIMATDETTATSPNYVGGVNTGGCLSSSAPWTASWNMGSAGEYDAFSIDSKLLLITNQNGNACVLALNPAAIHSKSCATANPACVVNTGFGDSNQLVGAAFNFSTVPTETNVLYALQSNMTQVNKLTLCRFSTDPNCTTANTVSSAAYVDFTNTDTNVCGSDVTKQFGNTTNFAGPGSNTWRSEFLTAADGSVAYGTGGAQDWLTDWTPTVTQSFILPTVGNSAVHAFQATAVTGATSGTEPTWSSCSPSCTDGGVTWTDVGTIGGQGPGFTIFVYRPGTGPGSGCSMINTRTGYIYRGGTTGTGPAIPASYFGLHVNPQTPQGFPLSVNFGSFRFWDSSSQWALISNCNSTNANCQSNPATYTSLSTSLLDGLLSSLYTSGVTDGLVYTLNRTPSWATAAPGFSNWTATTSYAKNTYVIPTTNNAGNYVFVALNSGTSGYSVTWTQTRNATQSDGGVTWQNIGQSTNCLYGTGECLVPADLNPDGSGADKIWDNWITQLATYVNGSSYRLTHSHIKYWEPWNEWWEDSTANASWSGTEETNATYAQMLRVTEDTRCIIEGVGTIHNYPSAGSSTTCSAYLTALGQSAIDTTAMILSPSGSQYVGNNRNVSQNFLYCNASPSNDYNGASSCTWAPTSGLVANCNSSSCFGSSAVDVINYHIYVGDTPSTYQPEQEGTIISGIRSFLSATDQAKPFFSDEGSSGSITGEWGDSASQAGFVPRFYALYWTFGITGNWWYGYNNTLLGTLATGSGATLTSAGVAYNTTFSWLAGGTPTDSTFCANSGTLYTCPFTQANGTKAELVWDSQFGPGGSYGGSYADCSTSPNTTVCGTTSYTVPSLYSGPWFDVTGASHAYASTVTVGAMPVLLSGTPAGLIQTQDGIVCTQQTGAVCSGSNTVRLPILYTLHDLSLNRSGQYVIASPTGSGHTSSSWNWGTWSAQASNAAWTGSARLNINNGVWSSTATYTAHDVVVDGTLGYPGVFYTANVASTPTTCSGSPCPPNASPTQWTQTETAPLDVIYDTTSANAAPCTDYQNCTGHQAQGYLSKWYNNTLKQALYSDPVVNGDINPGTTILQTTLPADFHGSYRNSGTTDLTPVFALDTSVPAATVGYTAACYLEVCATPSTGPVGGVYTLWRLGHEYNTGSSPFFGSQNNVGVVSYLGDLVAFGTDMMGKRGDQNSNAVCANPVRGMYKPAAGMTLTINGAVGDSVYPLGTSNNDIYQTTIAGLTSGSTPTGGWGQLELVTITQVAATSTTATYTYTGNTLAAGGTIIVSGLTHTQFNGSGSPTGTGLTIATATSSQFTVTGTYTPISATSDGGTGYTTQAWGAAVVENIGSNSCRSDIVILDPLSAHAAP
jgi:hypothetical protein